jgi:hypothetical protein
MSGDSRIDVSSSIAILPRDLRCHRCGFGLRYARCHGAARLEMLLLLGALATLVVWLVGLAALQLNRHLQVNTERRRDVLSNFFIGRELLRRLDDLPRPVIDLAPSRSDITYPRPRRHEFVGILQNGLLGGAARRDFFP